MRTRVASAADGTRLAFEVSGSGQPVLLLSGFAADRTFWAGVVDRLAGCRTLVTMDNRGVGESDAPDCPYDVATMADDASTVLAAAGIAGPVDVVGHSMGGAIALRLAREHPARIGRVVLAQAFSRFVGPGEDVLRSAASAYEKDPAPVRALAEALYPWLFAAAFLDAAGVWPELLRLAQANPHPQTRAGYERQLEALASFDAGSWLALVRHPALVIGAREDRLVPAEETARLVSGLPAARCVVIDGAGHCAPGEQPDLVAALVRGWTGR